MRTRILSVILIVCAALPAALFARTPSGWPTKDDYARLTEWRFAAVPVPVPPQGLVLRKDTASWTLESGGVRLMEPVSNGTATGLVFEGQGRFVMTIPDRLEVNELRRFSKRPDIAKVDVPFTRLVLRTSGGMLAALTGGPAPASYAKSDVAKDRHERWLRTADLDADARVVAGLRTPGDDYLIVDAETADFGWLMYEYDPRRQEEVTLTKLQKENDFEEIWVSLDRPEQRDNQGRPTSSASQTIDVTDVDVEIDLRSVSDKTLDVLMPERDWIHFKARMGFRPLTEGSAALYLSLDPLARVRSVRGKDGAEIPFLRDATGKRFALVENERNNSALTVLLDHALPKGADEELTVEYDMKLYNYASGRDWYPGEATTGAIDAPPSDVHTGRLEFLMTKKYEVRAVGVPEAVFPRVDDFVAVWNVTKPVKMMGFTFGKSFKEEKLKFPDLPEIDSFGAESGVTSGDMVRNVGADIVNSLNFYRKYFGVPITAERLYAARIMAFHGQAFDGFIHLSYLTYDAEHPGYTEIFRAHEAAHQYWGHLVGWRSYRDQWLSEAFAEYSALMFIQATMKDSGNFEKFLTAYTAELTGQGGSLDAVMRRSSGGAPTAEQRRRVGPIGVGYRAGTSEVPDGAVTQLYHKGALVLHMIRQICWAGIQDRDAFRETLQDFLKMFAGKEASTLDFFRVLTMHTGLDWSAFFENWVYGAAIPTLTWSYTVSNSTDAEGKYPCSLRIVRADVPDGFSFDVPVEFDFGGKKWSIVWLTVDQPERTFEIPLQAKPKKVTFNPFFSVLARVNKEK